MNVIGNGSKEVLKFGCFLRDVAVELIAENMSFHLKKAPFVVATKHFA